MTRYFFHLNECGRGTRDDEGKCFADDAAARAHAVAQARSIMAAEVVDGRLCLSCNIEVADEAGARIFDVPFKEAVELSGV